ncbi:MAG: hypothetical protein H6705_06385 [Myxococcales bacterium]|nr:hypothetical protein [Myxococcales bacterium]
MKTALALLLALALLAGCGDTDPYPTRCPALDACACPAPPCLVDAPTLTAAETVVPSDAMPPQIRSQPAHNNLDIAWHRDRLFFVFRTAPTHFASPEATLYVVSTTDHREWRYEGAFNERRDLREPRLLSVGGRLLLFYARLGQDSTDFEPGGAAMLAYNGPDDWSEPREADALGFPEGFIPWRFARAGADVYLTGYTGGEDIYGASDSDLAVYWLKSRDGLTWAPAVDGHPIVLRGGISETGFAFLPGEREVVMVARNEAGDLDPETGEPRFGSRICRGPVDDPAAWRCADDPRKYDSPLVFRHGEAIWLIGRRNVTETGHYDDGGEGTLVARRLRQLVDYWVTPKRCALWSVNPSTLAVEHVLDLPSAGDTCFASAVPLDGTQYLLYDYTSPVEETELVWMDGQRRPTLIHRMTLALP